jgi:serine protease
MPRRCTTQNRTRRSRPVFHRPSLEPLEDRTLPSVSSPVAPPYSTTDILVQFNTTGGILPVSELAGTTIGAELDPSTGLYQVNLSPGVTVAGALAAYRADPVVVSAEPDYNVSAGSANSSTAPLPSTPSTGSSTSSASNTIDLSGLGVNTSSYSPTDILAMFNPTAGTPTSQLAGTTIGTELDPSAGMYQVKLSAGVTVARALAAYRADPNVVAAEPDYNLADSSVSSSTGVVPNNPDFSQQWDLSNTGQNGGTPGADIGATKAWTVTTGSPNVVVGVLDTGVDFNQPDLYQNIWINQAEIPKSRLKNLVDVYHDGYISMRDLNNPINWGPYKIEPGPNGVVTAAQILAPMGMTNGKDNGTGGWAYPGNTQDGDTAHPNDFIGWNFVYNNNDPMDENGHGTFVAGEIAGMGNSGTGTAGVDWNVQIMPVQFLGSNGWGTISNFIAALNYSVEHGAKITNNSWQGASNNPFLEAAIANARQHGQIFVAAAGNGGSNNDVKPEYPSGFPLNNVVAVAATDNKDNLASFSNYGSRTVDLAAPGVNILGPVSNTSYQLMSGTSMSTPLVTGALALVWGEHPTWTYTQVINQVLDTVTKVPSLAGKTVTGGVLNLAAAVGYKAPPSVTPQVVRSAASGPAANTDNDVRLTFNEAINPATLTSSTVTLTGPSGRAIPISSVTPVAGSGNTQFDVHFATQTAGGTYTLVVGPNVKDVAGNAMTAAYKTTFGIVPTYTFHISTSIPMRAGARLLVSPLTVNQNATIGQATVQLNITYPHDGDLVIFLQAPDGTMILLSDRRGGSGANFENTTFTDQASTPIASGKAPFDGSYRPDTPLSRLDGKSATGIWKLWIENLGSASSGSVNLWSLTITPQIVGTAKSASIASVASLPGGSSPPPTPSFGGFPSTVPGFGFVPPLPDSGPLPTPPFGGRPSTPPLPPASTATDRVFSSSPALAELHLETLFPLDDSGEGDPAETSI